MLSFGTRAHSLDAGSTTRQPMWLVARPMVVYCMRLQVEGWGGWVVGRSGMAAQRRTCRVRRASAGAIVVWSRGIMLRLPYVTCLSGRGGRRLAHSSAGLCSASHAFLPFSTRTQQMSNHHSAACTRVGLRRLGTPLACCGMSSDWLLVAGVSYCALQPLPALDASAGRCRTSP